MFDLFASGFAGQVSNLADLFAFGFSGQEFWIILIVVLILFGGKKIPELMRGVGKGVGELQKGIEEGKKTMEKTMNEPDPPASSETKAG